MCNEFSNAQRSQRCQDMIESHAGGPGAVVALELEIRVQFA